MGNTLTLRLLLSFVTIVVAVAISLLLPYDPDVRLAIVLAGGPLLLGMLNGSLTAVFQGQMRMGRAVTADVVGRVVAFGLAVLVATLDLGFFAVMGTAAGGALASPGGLGRALAPARAHPLPGRPGGVAQPAALQPCRWAWRWRSTRSTSAPTR